MNSYPEVVAKIANDYLERVKTQLRLAPSREQSEFLAEIESHMYEAYQQRLEEDDVARILAVLRNLGEPAEVVSDRFPAAMASSGKRRNLPLYVLGGILIAMFGIPLGFGGLGVLVGILAALAGMAVAFYATAGSIFLVGALFTLLGLIRVVLPELFDRLVMLGLFNINPSTAEFLSHFSRSDQNLLMILFGCVWLACGYGMLRLGKYLFRGLRFLYGLLIDRTRRLAQVFRTKMRPENRAVPHVAAASFGLGSRP